MTTPLPAALPERIWTCQIGGHGELPQGADGPMRNAIASAFKAVTGRDASYCFSGWGQPLPERYRAVVENRLPDPGAIRHECFAVLDTLPDAVTAPGGDFAALQSQPAAFAPTEHIKEPYTLAELNARIASNDYNAELLLHHAMLLLNAQPAAAGVSDDDLRAMWRQHGGMFHGPLIETGTMPEAKLLAFLRAILALRPQAVPMTDEQALGYWKIAARASSRYSPAEAYYKGIADAEAHHGITAPAGGEGK